MAARYGLTLVTPPETEPITLTEAKLHCRDVVPDEDALVTALIVAARVAFESRTYRQLITATWRLSIDRFPPGRGLILLPRAPLQYAPPTTAISIVYTSVSGQTTTLDPSWYQVSAAREPARIIPKPGQIWPIVAWQTADAVQITYTAGYGEAAAVPQLIKQGMLLLIGAWFEHREQLLAGTSINELPAPVGVNSIFAAFDCGDDFEEYGGRHTDLPEFDATRRQLNELGYY